MATATKPRSKGATPAAQVLAFAKERAANAANWTDLHNAVFSESGICATLFSTPDARKAFLESPQGKEVWALINAAKENGETPQLAVSGKLLIRLPLSLHAAIIKEADAEGTSINQLVVAKLSAQLRTVLSKK